jgi:hypothetical protein
MGKIWLVLILAAAMIYCGGEPVREAQTKDLQNFRLPEEITRNAPHMQAHLYRMLPFVSPRYQIKPRFVFAEGPNPTIDSLAQGPLEPLVVHMSMIHAAYYHNDTHKWSGSVLVGLEQGVAAVSRDGYQIKVSPNQDQWEISFQDGDQVFTHVMAKDEDKAQWLREGDRALYLYHYTFPEAFFRQR